MTFPQIQPAGFLKRLSDNYSLKCAEFTFDYSDTDPDGAANSAIGAHKVHVDLPAGAFVCGGFLDVLTVFDSAASTATIAVHVEGANDIVSAAAVSGAPWSTTGIKAIIPKINTPESTGIKCTVARDVTVTVAVQVLTQGRMKGYLFYLALGS